MRGYLSDGEWKLMNKLWEVSPQTVAQLTAALREETGWERHTVITMLSRLEAKGAVCHRGSAPKVWSAALSRREAQRGATASFLDKVYGGRLGHMVNAMVDAKALTSADLEELAAILEKAKEGEGR